MGQYKKGLITIWVIGTVALVGYFGYNQFQKLKNEYITTGFNAAGHEFVNLGQRDSQVILTLDGKEHKFIYVKPSTPQEQPKP